MLIYIYIYIYTYDIYIYIHISTQSVTAHNNIIKTKNLMKALYPVILNGN